MTENQQQPASYLKIVIAQWFVIAALVVAVIVLAILVLAKPDITVTSGEVVNVSHHAIVIDTPDGRINGLLATEEDVQIGDLVQVTVVEEPNVLYVEVRG